MVKEPGKTGSLIGIRGDKIHPQVPGGDDFDLGSEAVLEEGLHFLRAPEITHGHLKKGLLDIVKIRDHFYVIPDHMFHMIDEPGIPGIRIAPGLAGQETVALGEFPGCVQDAKPKLPRDQSPGDHLVIVDAQRTVFCNIGDLICHGAEEISQAVILAAAGGDEMDPLFLQAKDQGENFRVKLLSAI